MNRDTPNARGLTEANVLAAIKRQAVIPVSLSTQRSELLSLKQEHGKLVEKFAARVKGRTATCRFYKEVDANPNRHRVAYS